LQLRRSEFQKLQLWIVPNFIRHPRKAQLMFVEPIGYISLALHCLSLIRLDPLSG